MIIHPFFIVTEDESQNKLNSGGVVSEVCNCSRPLLHCCSYQKFHLSEQQHVVWERLICFLCTMGVFKRESPNMLLPGLANMRRDGEMRLDR